ncbi:MAG: hypothetical protein WCJ45_06880 [bacterium]
MEGSPSIPHCVFVINAGDVVTQSSTVKLDIDCPETIRMRFADAQEALASAQRMDFINPVE